MNEFFHGSEKKRWLKMKNRETAGPELLLRKYEPWYVAACGRFLKRESARARVWTFGEKTGTLSALVVQSKQTLLPVFLGRKDIPLPKFLCGFFSNIPVHSIQGLLDEALTLGKALEQLGRYAKENIDYDLMHINTAPNPGCCSSGPANLVIRRPRYTDLDALAALQAGYEQEEVLPRGAEFYPAASRMNTEHILSSEQIMTAELGGRLVGKINTSAVSFTRFQIGGVYVHPDFRGRGIARRMTAEFVRSLIAQGRGVTLFVKKTNRCAHRVYRRLGFGIMGDYRISYY
jgi:ribosomal protein S18 acetylase RimI-like enzyme